MKRLIEILCEKKVFVFLVIFVIVVAGIIAYQSLKIDVFPDPSPILVQIFTESEGMAAEEVEKFVSYPIETSLFGLPNVNKITSFSMFGLSTVNVYFDDQVDIYFARQLVAQQLPAITAKLPEFVEAPALGPITTGLGMVYIYVLESNLPSIELRTLQDWVIKFQLQTIPGIAAVMSQGGEVKQFQVIIDPGKLIKYKLDLHTVIEHIKKSSKNITAGYIVRNKEEYIIRGLGLLEEIEDLKKVVVKEVEAIPVFLENIADIKPGAAIKRGEALLNQKNSVVSGIVMKLIGVNTSELIEKINKKIVEINAGLPDGIQLVPVYNQALIIKAAFKTVSEALIIGIILVAIILFLFINDLPSALVSALSIPFAVFITFIVMTITGMTADLMSFGGLAIGIGLLVDATIVVVENISRNRENSKKMECDSKSILSAVGEVLRPLSYAMIMIILSFIPILTLSGVEGKMFRPFGFTLLVAIVSAIIYAVFISPALMNCFGARKLFSTAFIFNFLKKTYLRIFDFFYPRKKIVVVGFVLIFIFSIVVFFNMGSEFIPRLNEQTIQLETLLPQNTYLKETEKVINRTQQLIMEFDEVERVYGRIGRGESGTHPHPVNVGHSIIILKNRKYWKVKNEEELIRRIETRIKENIPGVLLNFTQPIKHNLDHLITGFRADLAIKIYGDDYNQLMVLADKIKYILEKISGVKDTQVTRVSGQNEIAVKLKRENLARFGLDPSDVMEEIEASFGGKNISNIYQGDVVYDVFIRYGYEFRKDLKDLRRYFIHSGKNQMIPLSDVAEVVETTGFSNITRENGKRYIAVQCNVRGRDIGSIVSESTEKIYKSIDLPFGYYLSWGGQYELKAKAEKKLYLVLFITLLLILILLFDYLKSWRDILVIMVNLPVSLSGGILSLWISGAYLSVPSTIGFLALLGIALENTLVLIAFFKRKTASTENFDGAIRESVALRLRPILMTKFTTIIGLFPLLFAAGIGSEIQRPLVVVVIGGIFFSIFTTLLLMPVIYQMLFRARLRDQ
jgi:cobalt-zinc-cadmium resistance protein CzcA